MFSIPLLSVPLPCCHKQSVSFRALKNPRSFLLCCSGCSQPHRSEGFYCDKRFLWLKLWIKYSSYQKFSFTSWVLHLIKRHLLLTFTCIQHHFKFTEFWTMTTKCAVTKQTGSYLCQAPVEANIFLFAGDTIYKYQDKTDPF